MNTLKVKTIFIRLGTACNMSCRHCSQLPVRVSSVKAERCSEELLDALVKWSKQDDYKRNIWFWGGEPLLYLDTIKDIVSRLEAKGADLNYTTTTNGLLLTQEVANYFNEHNFRVVMSYDAPNPTAVRQMVPSEENINAFLAIKNRNINTVFSPENCDLCAMIACIKEKFPDTHISIGFMQVMGPIPKDTYTYKKGSMLKEMRRAAERLTSGNDYDYTLFAWFRPRVKRWRAWGPLTRKSWLEEPLPPCGSGSNSVAFDLKGNYYPCHNGNITLGTVKEPFEKLMEKTMKFWVSMIPEGCLKCEHLDMCRNRCPMAMRKGDCYEQCSFMKEYWAVTKQVADEYGLFGESVWKNKEVNN